MNDEDRKRLAEIRERCEAAMPGPWICEGPNTPGCYEVIGAGGFPVIRITDDDDSGIIINDDADFIAHAWEDVPWLLERLGNVLKGCDS